MLPSAQMSEFYMLNFRTDVFSRLLMQDLSAHSVKQVAVTFQTFFTFEQRRIPFCSVFFPLLCNSAIKPDSLTSALFCRSANSQLHRLAASPSAEVSPPLVVVMGTFCSGQETACSLEAA